VRNKIYNQKSKPFESDKFVQQWLTGLSERTKQNYLEEIVGWLDFADMSPTLDGLLSYSCVFSERNKATRTFLLERRVALDLEKRVLTISSSL
jgi:hypothetical protein